MSDKSMSAGAVGIPSVVGFDACLYDILRDVVYDEGGIIFPSKSEAATYAIKMAGWTGKDEWDATVRTVYDNGIREVIYESADALAAQAVRHG